MLLLKRTYNCNDMMLEECEQHFAAVPVRVFGGVLSPQRRVLARLGRPTHEAWTLVHAWTLRQRIRIRLY